MYAIDEDDSENVEEATDNEEELQPWCLQEESESDQVQEVVSRRDKQKGEESQSSVTIEWRTVKIRTRLKIIEVKDRWVKATVTMDSGAAGHVMLEGMFLRV